MRETRQYGSEGGEARKPSLPLSSPAFIISLRESSALEASIWRSRTNARMISMLTLHNETGFLQGRDYLLPCQRGKPGHMAIFCMPTRWVEGWSFPVTSRQS